MSRILLVDDSPHAQRMGSASSAMKVTRWSPSATPIRRLIRLEDADPDVWWPDAVMPAAPAMTSASISR